jgi:adenylate cyclase
MEALDFPNASEATAAFEKAHSMGRQAVDLDEADSQAHICLGWPLLYRREYELMKKHVDRAVLLNPNDADTLANAAYLLTMYGEPDRAIALGETAFRLNPRYPDWYVGYLSTALLAARRYPEALAVRILAPDHFIDSTFIRAAILAHMDRPQRAHQWGDRAVERLSARPGSAGGVAKGCVRLLLDNNPWRRQEDRDHFAEGMCKAGVPE